MKVKVRTEFKDKHTGKLHKAEDELEMNVDRINEVLKVGNFIELVADAAEPKKSKADEKEQAENADTEADQADQKDAAEDTPKTTGRRKRTSK